MATKKRFYFLRTGFVETNLVGSCVKKGAKFSAIGLGNKSAPCRVIIQVAWKRPSVGWTTLNIDGSAVGNPSEARCGRLLRNSEGIQLKGFARGVGCTTSCVAKLCALRDGLNLASSLGLENLIV